MQTVGIQGLAASYSDAACRLRFPSARLSLYESFAEVFAALKTGAIDKAFLPFENSTAGFIAENYRWLDESGCFVEEDLVFRVEHCLLAPGGLGKEAVREVYSHPQALLQCQAYLRAKGYTPKPWFDTAGAARDLSRLSGAAAIASFEAAATYGLEVLEQGINDETDNHTRFFILGKERKTGSRVLLRSDKDSLAPILAEDLSLRSLLSLPEEKKAWEHRYYVEAQLRHADGWQDLQKKYPGLRLLGSFESQV